MSEPVVALSKPVLAVACLINFDGNPEQNEDGSPKIYKIAFFGDFDKLGVDNTLEESWMLWELHKTMNPIPRSPMVGDLISLGRFKEPLGIWTVMDTGFAEGQVLSRTAKLLRGMK